MTSAKRYIYVPFALVTPDCTPGTHGRRAGIISVVVLVFGLILTLYEVLCVYVWNAVTHAPNVSFLASREFDKFLLINETVVTNHFNVMEEIRS